jgi:hypothetical protein
MYNTAENYSITNERFGPWVKDVVEISMHNTAENYSIIPSITDKCLGSNV